MIRTYNAATGHYVQKRLKDGLHDVIEDYLPESRQNDDFMDRTKSVECVNMLDSILEVIKAHLEYAMEEALK